MDHEEAEAQQLAFMGPDTTTCPRPRGDWWSDFVAHDRSWSSGISPNPKPNTLSPPWNGPPSFGPSMNDEEIGNSSMVSDQVYANSIDSIDSIDSALRPGTGGVEDSHGQRFLHKLNAPPALIRKPDEDAVTYLNKGSTYSLLVQDTLPCASESGNTLYCTSVQIAFDTESRRKRPLVSWRLWDQGRGADEGHLFNGRFQAIKFVDSRNPDNPNNMSNLQVVHSDGFSLVWSVDPGLPRHCSIKFQLNFLSTDFSHAKGVHGVTMQLCCKTEEVSTTSLRFPTTDPEISYCRIQIFRSHGAERKTSNDAATAAKRIEKLKQKLHPSKLGPKQKNDGHGQHERKMSTNSGDMPKRIRSLGKAQEEEVRSRLRSLQKLCTVTRRETLLDQQGEKQQHCDWYPTSHEMSQDKAPGFNASWSPSKDPMPAALTSIITTPSMHCTGHTPGSSSDDSGHATSDVADPWSLGMTAMPPLKPRVACFYVRSVQRERYAPIYLVERTVNELTRRVAAAVLVDATSIHRCIWLCDKGFRIMVDDDVVQNLKEGQGMQVAINNIRGELVELELEF